MTGFASPKHVAGAGIVLAGIVLPVALMSPMSLCACLHPAHGAFGVDVATRSPEELRALVGVRA